MGTGSPQLPLLRRYLGWELVFWFYNVINTLTIGLIGFSMPAGAQRNHMVVYLAIGALLWNFLSILFQEVSNSVQWERWEGTIEYSFMAPIRRLTYLLGVCAWAVLYGMVRTLVVLLGVALFFHVSLKGADLSGVYYPISVLPHWIRWAAVLSPATYTLEAVRRAVLNGAPVHSLLTVSLGLLASGVVLIPVGLGIFMLAERYAMRTGSLKRNG